MAFHGSHLGGGHLGAETAPANAVAPTALTQPATTARIPPIVLIAIVAIVTFLLLKQLNKAKSE